MSIKKLSPKPTSEWLRVLDFRMINLRWYADALEALANAGKQILSVDAASPPLKLDPYPIQASIVVMICATVESILRDLVEEAKRINGLSAELKDDRGSVLEKVRNYFKKEACMQFPDDTVTWSKLKALFELRNAVVHAWGRVGYERRRTLIKSLKEVVVSETGEINLGASAVDEALSVMRDFGKELQEHLARSGGIVDGT